MKLSEVLSVGGNVVGYVLASVQSNEIFQIIEFALSITASLVIIGFKIYQWARKAMEDGKIDEKELEELDKIVDEATEDLERKKK